MINPSSSQLTGLPDSLRAGLVNFMNANGISSNDIASIGIPVILVPNGTVATNGTITVGTALPTTYTSAWVYLPAGAVVGGSAGLYYCVFSSTTVGQVYTAYGVATAAWQPSIPATLVAAVGSNAAYTTATGADAPLLCFSLSPGVMGLKGAIRADVHAANNNSVGNKILKQKLGAATVNTTTSTTDVVPLQETTVVNRGVAAKQLVRTRNFTASAVAATSAYATVNTAAASTFSITGQLATATDYLVIEAVTYELITQ